MIDCNNCAWYWSNSETSYTCHYPYAKGRKKEDKMWCVGYEDKSEADNVEFVMGLQHTKEV